MLCCARLAVPSAGVLLPLLPGAEGRVSLAQVEAPLSPCELEDFGDVWSGQLPDLAGILVEHFSWSL